MARAALELKRRVERGVVGERGRAGAWRKGDQSTLLSAGVRDAVNLAWKLALVLRGDVRLDDLMTSEFALVARLCRRARCFVASGPANLARLRRPARRHPAGAGKLNALIEVLATQRRR